MWPFRKKNDEVPAPAEPEGSWLDAFSTHRNVNSGWAELTNRMSELYAATPKPLLPEGMTFDHAGISGIKSAYAYSQPNIPEALISWFAFQTFIGWQTAALVAQKKMVMRCCEMPARDAVRHGWRISLKGLPENADHTDIIEAIEKADKRLKVKKHLQEFVTFGRVFGIRHAIFHVDGSDEFRKNPFNPDGVKPKSYKGISQVDPYWMTPLLDAEAASDAASMHFYEPTWWNIQGTEYHRTHLSIFRNSPVADILKPAYLYGGVPVPQQIMERLYCAERTANEAPQLVMTKRTTVWKTDAEKILTNQYKFLDSMAKWIRYRDNYGVKIINSQSGHGDDMTQFDTALGDLDNVIMTQFYLVAADAGLPATKYLGTSPKGFNSTGEYEEANYHEDLESLQENDLTPFLDHHYTLLMHSEIAPNFGLDPKKVEIVVEWNPLDSPTAKEKAEINEIKSRTALNLVNAGSIDAIDIRDWLKNDPESDFAGIPDPEPETEERMLEKSLEDVDVKSAGRSHTGMDSSWKEEDHPRDDEGKFSETEKRNEKKSEESRVYVPKSMTEAEAQEAWERGEIPEGWQIHGRSAQRPDFSDVVQLSESTAIAEQYAGYGKGDIWYFAPSNEGKSLDFSDTSSPDFERIYDKFKDDFEKDRLPDQDSLSEDMEDAWESFKSSFAPEDIVNSAEAYDNSDWVEWLLENFDYEVAYVKTPDGGVVLDFEKVQKIKVPNPWDW